AGVPIGADALEDAGAVVQRVRCQADVRVGELLVDAVLVGPSRLGDLGPEGRCLLQPFTNAAGHPLPPLITRKPPGLGRLRWAGLAVSLAERASSAGSSGELDNDDEKHAARHEDANAKASASGRQCQRRPMTSPRCHTRRATSSAAMSAKTN